MIKNDLKLNMLFAILVFFITSCSVNRPNVQRKSPNISDSSYVRKNIGDVAKQYVGVKYRYGGKSPKGFDCSGFTKYVFNEFNIELSPSSSLQARQGKKVNLKWAKPGDLLFFGRGGKITHVALILKNSKKGIEVIHSTSSKGVMTQNVTASNYWKRRMLFARNVLD